MSKRVNGKKGNNVRKHKTGGSSHCTKVRGTSSGRWFAAGLKNKAAAKAAEAQLKD